MDYQTPALFITAEISPNGYSFPISLYPMLWKQRTDELCHSIQKLPTQSARKVCTKRRDIAFSDDREGNVDVFEE